MKITLMSKTVPVMDLDIDAQTSYVKELLRMKNPAYLPIGIPVKDEETLKQNFTSWWRDRAIPASRKLIKEKLRELHLTGMTELVNRSLGLSLSDPYWICPLGADIRWEDINYFENDFSLDIGQYLAGECSLEEFEEGEGTRNLLASHSPDITTDGDVQKRWIIEHGTRFLLKNGATTFQQEPFNEVIATMALRHFTAPFVPYTLVRQKSTVYSKCPCFIDADHEYVTAYNLCKDFAKPGRHPEDALEAAVTHYEVPGVAPFIDQLILLDDILMNEDRHWSNFGFLRNVNTLKFEGPAPIFDNGNSLWYKIPDFIPEHYDHALMFRRKHEKERKLIKTRPDVDFDGLARVPEAAEALLCTAPHIDERRAHRIATHFAARIQQARLAIDG